MVEHGSRKNKFNFVIVRDPSLKGKGLPGVHKKTLFDSPRAKKQWHMTQEGFQMQVSEQSINESHNYKLPTLTSPPEPLQERPPDLLYKPPTINLLNRTMFVPSLLRSPSPKEISYSHINDPASFFQG